MSAPRIGLTGFYGHGNFGDDLMALQFGLALREAGVPFCVYRLCRPYAERYGFEVASSPAELLESAELLVWGGGGLLVSWPDLLYRILFRGAARDFTKIVSGALERGIDLLACSVGGDGSCTGPLTPNFKESFVQASKYITVRNPEDLEILRRTGTPGAYYPDIMWLACERFPVTRRTQEGFRIGIDLYPSNLLRQRAWNVFPLLGEILLARPDCEFVFVDTTNRSRKNYSGLARLVRGPNVRSHQFSEPDADLEFLGSLDLLVSSRLHTPMVAMQCGVPCLFLCAEKKTRLMLASIGLEKLHYGPDNLSAILRLIGDRKETEWFVRDFPFPDVAELRAGATGHIRHLKRELERRTG